MVHFGVLSMYHPHWLAGGSCWHTTKHCPQHLTRCKTALLICWIKAALAGGIFCTALPFWQDNFLGWIYISLLTDSIIQQNHETPLSLSHALRVSGFDMRVERQHVRSGNWHGFLRVDENKTELFMFLSVQIVHRLMSADQRL